MLKRLIEIASRPKKPMTRTQTMIILGVQLFFLLFLLLVVSFFPERAVATAPIIFFCLGISIALWLEAFENLKD